ncbi:MAG: orotate phosphoribosyltransferase [Candidatus Methanomarinus sp.]|uniref:Orotate phosphoribosyltransferase n=1 Tax=Candidatus Methanomarinus sp. TaxID=3386244 RepID=A0AC61SAH0_9EURY|nr:MAG: orotate phosphoribosyltransferase [ANME-2 cluster archaeon]
MEFKGICTICQTSGTMYTCALCGRLVCGNCFDIARGVCIRCSRGSSPDSIVHYPAYPPPLR